MERVSAKVRNNSSKMTRGFREVEGEREAWRQHAVEKVRQKARQRLTQRRMERGEGEDESQRNVRELSILVRACVAPPVLYSITTGLPIWMFLLSRL